MNIDPLRKHALSLPEVTEQPHHHLSSFRVRGKIFVTVPPAGTHIHVFVAEQDRERALALEPDCVEKLFWGGKVVGLRVALSKAKPAFARGLVSKAWAQKAPRSLVNRKR
jgi:hypothetical protein